VAGVVAAEPERVARLWADAEVGGDGAAQITEVIDYDFASRQRHGIYRDIPGLDPADPVRVHSDSVPDQVQVTGTAHQPRLRIGDPGRTVTGRHRYIIGYRLAGVAPGGRLAWDAVGTSRTVPTGQVEVHVVAPVGREEVVCVRGVAGSTTPARPPSPNPGTWWPPWMAWSPARVSPSTPPPASAWPPPRPCPPRRPGARRPRGTGPLPPALTSALAALAGAVAATWLVRRAGRERVAAGGAAEAAFGPGRPPAGPERRVDSARLGELATVEFVPPDELTPAQGGVLLAEEVRHEHKVAWLIGSAVNGFPDLEGDGPLVTLVRLPRRQGAPAYLLDAAFGDRDRLTLGSYDPQFAAAWKLVGNELDGWRRTSALWDPAGDRRRALAWSSVSSPGWPGRARPRPSAPGSCGSGPRPGRPCGCGPSRSGGSWPPPRPTTPRRRPSAATCASTPPGRWPWASWTAGRRRWSPPR